MDRGKITISEIFGPTIQGEGLYTGVPSIFIRVRGCNLRCHFANGSICDTPYTSIHPEPAKLMTMEEIVSSVREKLSPHTKLPHIVITGGEPLLYKDMLSELVLKLMSLGLKDFTVETNGSIFPPDDIIHNPRVFWSVSPKLSSSCCFDGSSISSEMQELHKSSRINIAALYRFITSGNYQFKFVYSGPECVEEIKELASQIIDYAENILHVNWPDLAQDIQNHIWLMPEGATQDQLKTTAEGAVQAAIKTGWRYCDRTHIRIWDSKRAV